LDRGALGVRRPGLGARGRIAIKLLAAIFVTELLLRVAFTVYAVRLEPGCGWERLSLIRLVVAYRVHFGWEGDVEFASPPFVLDPRRGYKLAPDVRGVLHNGTVVNSNSLGARGRREYMLPKPSGRPRFLALGDSLTFGEGVADDETWPALLEASADVEVVNLGAPAYAHDQMYFALVDDGLGLQPDRVILGFHPGDMIRNLFTFYCWEKPCWRREGGEWRLLNVPNSGADQYRDRLFVPLLWALPRALLEPPDLGDIDADPEGEAVTTHALDMMRRACADAGIPLTLVLLPDEHQTAAWTRGECAGCRYFSSYCEQAGADCLDLVGIFASTCAASGGADGPCFVDGGKHPGPRGYRLVAEALREHLRLPR